MKGSVWIMSLMIAVGLSTPGFGQVSATPVDRLDSIAFRDLFRRAVRYKALTEAVAPTKDKKINLSRTLGRRYGLNQDDGANLERISVAYLSEATSLHSRIVQLIAQFHARFPNRIITTGVADTNPPAEIEEIQHQEDTLTIHYRDLLRNELGEVMFASLHEKLLSDFQNQAGMSVQK